MDSRISEHLLRWHSIGASRMSSAPEMKSVRVLPDWPSIPAHCSLKSAGSINSRTSARAAGDCLRQTGESFDARHAIQLRNGVVDGGDRRSGRCILRTRNVQPPVYQGFTRGEEMLVSVRLPRHT